MRSFSATFTNQPSSRAPIFAVYADFGLTNDVSLAALIKDSSSGGFDYVRAHPQIGTCDRT